MIYKYCRPNSHSENNLRDSVLRCRHFEDFNDPFEFWAKFEQGIPTVADAKRLKAAFATWGFPDGDPETLEDWKEYFDSLEGCITFVRSTYPFDLLRTCGPSREQSAVCWCEQLIDEPRGRAQRTADA
jgi:hypothetical protein